MKITSHRSDEDGFGLVEMVVSMLILAALAVAFLPLLIQGLKQSAQNTTTATATQLVNQQIQLAQSKGPACAAVRSVAGTQDLTDPRGVVIRVTTTVATCPSGVGTVAVTVSALRVDTGATTVTAKTLVFVQ